MARIALFVPDLLFGSGVMAALQGAGHRVELVPAPQDAAEAEMLIVDLTVDSSERIERTRTATLPDIPKLAFYSHVESEVRAQAEAAGFDLVVPRSRMARDAPRLVERVLAGAG